MADGGETAEAKKPSTLDIEGPKGPVDDDGKPRRTGVYNFYVHRTTECGMLQLQPLGWSLTYSELFDSAGRDRNHGVGAHNHGRHRFRCAFNSMEYRADGMDRRAGCVDTVCVVHSLHLSIVGRLLPPSRSGEWEA